MQPRLAVLLPIVPTILLIALTLVKAADAATAYNTFDVSDEESAAAASSLHEALSEFHLMLSSLEQSSLDAAASHKRQAASKLASAINEFNTVAVMEMQNDSSIRASEEYQRLSQRLESLGIDIPATRAQLAQVAVEVTHQFQNALAQFSIDEWNSMQDEVHELIRLSLRLQDIGVLASRVWRDQLN